MCEEQGAASDIYSYDEGAIGGSDIEHEGVVGAGRTVVGVFDLKSCAGGVKSCAGDNYCYDGVNDYAHLKVVDKNENCVYVEVNRVLFWKVL